MSSFSPVLDLTNLATVPYLFAFGAHFAVRASFQTICTAVLHSLCLGSILPEHTFVQLSKLHSPFHANCKWHALWGISIPIYNVDSRIVSGEQVICNVHPISHGQFYQTNGSNQHDLEYHTALVYHNLLLELKALGFLVWLQSTTSFHWCIQPANPSRQEILCKVQAFYSFVYSWGHQAVLLFQISDWTFALQCKHQLLEESFPLPCFPCHSDK